MLNSFLFDFSYIIEEVNVCTKNIDCGSCIRHPECAWCADPSWEVTQHRNKQSNIIDGSLNKNNPAFSDTSNVLRRRPRCDLVSR